MAEVIINMPELNKFVRQIVLDKLELAGALVESSAQKNIAAMTKNPSGYLMGSITHEVNESGLSVKIGTNVEYAPYVEFGTGQFAENGKGREGGWVYHDSKGFHFTLGMKSMPFLRRALYDNLIKIKQIFAK